MTQTMRTGNAVLLTAAALLIVVVVWVVYAVAVNQRESPEDESARLRAEALADLELVDFTATAPTGETLTEALFEGRWTLLSFGFTHCQVACPPMHANTMRLMSKLQTTPVAFVTISVDPVHDTPERLGRYMDQIGADPERWRFLAVDKATRDAILGGLAMGVTIDESEANRITLPGSDEVMDNIDHPTRFILIGPDGNVVDLYPGLEAESLDETARSIRNHMISG